MLGPEELARKQKRIKDWIDIRDTLCTNEELKVMLSNKILALQASIATFWSSTDHETKVKNEAEISNLERELVTLAEEARLSARTGI